MSETAAMISGVPGRYATALFDLANEGDALDAIAQDVATLGAALKGAPDVVASFSNPSFSRGDLEAAATALADKLGLGDLLKNTLALMAKNRRLGQLPATLAAFETLVADKRGEITVTATSAQPMRDAQKETLVSALERSAGKKVHLQLDVDPELIGGLIVKMGSTMIDASIRSKLSSLQHAMREAG